MIEKLLLVYLIVFPFGQLLRLKIPNSEIVVQPADLVVFIIVLAWAFRNKFKLSYPKNARHFIYFLTLLALSLLVNSGRVLPLQFITGAFYWLRLAVYVFFYFALFDLFHNHFLKKDKILKWLSGVGIAVSIFGVLQYFLLPDLRFLLASGWDDHFFRLAGTFLDPGFTGLIVVLFSLLMFSRIWGRVEDWRWGIVAIINLGVIALTYSRASYLALVSGLTILYIVRRRLRYFLSVLLIFTFFVLLLPHPGGEGVNLSRTSTISARFGNYTEGLEVFSKNPVFGVGFDLYRYLRPQTQYLEHSGSGSDSSLLFLLATGGLVGFLSFLSLVSFLVRELWEKKNTQMGSAPLACLAAIFIHSLFINSLFYPWVLGFLAILLAAV